MVPLRPVRPRVARHHGFPSDLYQDDGEALLQGLHVGATNTGEEGIVSAERPLTYTVPQAAEMLNLGKTTIYRMIGKGEIRPLHFGTRTVITHTELVRVLDEQMQQQHGDMQCHDEADAPMGKVRSFNGKTAGGLRS